MKRYSFAFIVWMISVSLYSQEWYIPKPVNMINKGSIELGTRISYTANGDGILESSQMENDYYGRFSPFNKLEIYLSVPLIYSKQEKFDQNLNIIEKSATGIGDMFSQFSYEGFSGPDWKIVYNVDLSFPTGKNPYDNDVGLGSGHFSLGFGQTVIKVIDPVALFGYIGYKHSFKKKFSAGDVSPGSDIRFKAGSSIVLNPRITTNFNVMLDLVGKTEVNNSKLPASSSNSVYFGWGINWKAKNNINVSVDSVFGMTKVATDSTIILGFSWLP